MGRAPRRTGVAAPPFPPGVRVRRARVEDAEKLHALYHAAYSVHEDPHRPPIMALKDSVDDVRAYIEEGDVLVAEDERGELVASIHARVLVNLRRLAVAPARKGEGLGGAMLEAAMEEARQEGRTWAMLDTLPTHPWLPSFYKRHGFVERCLETWPDGMRWLQFRRRLR